MRKRCEKCNAVLPKDCPSSVYSCALGSSCGDIVAKKYKDRDGDHGVQLEWKFDSFGRIWRNLQYRNGRTSWQPDNFLEEVYSKIEK